MHYATVQLILDPLILDLIVVQNVQ